MNGAGFTRGFVKVTSDRNCGESRVEKLIYACSLKSDNGIGIFFLNDAKMHA